MSRTEINNILYDLESKARRGRTCDEAARVIEPLVWYINTGRCSTELLTVLASTNSRQRTTIVRRLASSGSYDDAIASIMDYLVQRFPCLR